MARIEAGADLTLTLRDQCDGRAYRLTVQPNKGRITLATPKSEWHRDGCRIDATKPVTLRVFLDGSMLECFVNDAYAISRRVYDLEGGKARVQSSGKLTVETLRLMGIAGAPPMAAP